MVQWREKKKDENLGGGEWQIDAAVTPPPPSNEGLTLTQCRQSSDVPSSVNVRQMNLVPNPFPQEEEKKKSGYFNLNLSPWVSLSPS